MIALCVGMYRACSTWQYGVVGSILEKHRDGQRLGFVEGIRYDEKLTENPLSSDWAVLKAHDYHSGFGELLATGQAIGFYSYRDLRDVISSYVTKTGTDLETLLDRGFIDLCHNNDRAWRSQPGMLVQSYDELIANPADGVAAIARHLGVELAPGEAAAIADATSLDANRRKVESMSARLRDQGVTLVAQDLTRFDPVSLLHWNHIRAQTPDAGTDPAATRQRSIVESHCRPWLIANGFPVAAETPAEPSVVRTSYAPAGVDIRLDRLFRGVKGTVFDFDAPHPTTPNASYHFFLRGWRGLNIATRAVARDEFVDARRGDVNVACPLGSPDQAATTLLGLVHTSRLQPPDLVILNHETDADVVVAAILATNWQPRVFVVDQGSSSAWTSTWPRQLDQAGYRAVPGLAGPAVLVRAYLATKIPLLARPLGVEDHFRWASEDLVPAQALRSVPAPAGVPGVKSWMRHLGSKLSMRTRKNSAAILAGVSQPRFVQKRDRA